jgi:hypothetical protein
LVARSRENKVKNKKLNNNLWLGDSGASCHMSFSDEGMFYCKTIRTPIKIADGKDLYATKIGKKKLLIKQKDGTTMDVILEHCKYVPGLWVNLFSISAALRNKWNISNEREIFILSKQNQLNLTIFEEHEVV